MQHLKYYFLDERVEFGKIREMSVEDINRYLKENDAQIIHKTGYAEPYKFYDKVEDVPMTKRLWFHATLTVVPRGTQLWKMKGTEGDGHFVFHGQEIPTEPFMERLA